MRRETAEPTEPFTPFTFESAYARFAPYVARIALRVLGRASDVNDVVHDVFLASRTRFAQFDSLDSARAFLGVVTVRMAKRRLRRSRLLGFFGLTSAHEAHGLVDTGATGEQRALIGKVYAVLNTLPVNHRLAWTLRYVEGASLDEVARLCRCSLASAKRWIASAHEAVSRETVHE